jgi:hypothetical protein
MDFEASRSGCVEPERRAKAVAVAIHRRCGRSAARVLKRRSPCICEGTNNLDC